VIYMSFEESRLEVIDRLAEYVSNKFPHQETALLKKFVREYYLSVSAEDLSSHSILDLYGAVVSHWRYLYERQPGQAKVRAFNPELEKEGWQSKHTIIEIVFDDMPFLVDSVTIALKRLNLNIHLVIHMGNLKLIRDQSGKIEQYLEKNVSEESLCSTDAVIYIEIDKQSDERILENIKEELKQVLEDVRAIVNDWPQMREKALLVLDKLEKTPPPIDQSEIQESVAFMKWAVEDHFTFLGYQAYDADFKNIIGSEFGVIKLKKDIRSAVILKDLPAEAVKLILSQKMLILQKTNERSTVHRPAYMDVIMVKQFNNKGEVIGAECFFGLYTAVVYNSTPKYIPYLRRKVSHVLVLAGFPPNSHDDRALLNILETLPRDDLLQGSEEEILELSMGILYLQERQHIRLFVRKDAFGSFVSCLVFVPRDKFTSMLGDKMKSILLEAFQGLEVEFSTRFSDSSLARLSFVVRLNPRKVIAYNLKKIEEELVESGRTWQDNLKDTLEEQYDEEQSNDLFKRYENAFPAGYQETFEARIAAVDIKYFETVSEKNPLAMNLYRPLEEAEGIIRFKLFRRGATIPLSDVVPVLENMGLRIISERPYAINLKNGQETIWINEYRMIYQKKDAFDIEAIKTLFQDAFDAIWNNHAENDGFNRLILAAKLTWREIMVLRAYAKYLWQAGFTFSQDHVEDTLTANPEISAMLAALFRFRFDPKEYIEYSSESQQLVQKQLIEKALEKVSNLNEDRILRRYMEVILATIRTNYYQVDINEKSKPYFSFKLDSKKVPELPLPVPLYEIFVYSPRVEAIHLRVAKVARGGIRWSDRREDFRTEILGLMKTQQVKNSVIVPMGAKGGFFVKKIPTEGTREQVMDEVIYCYQTLIRGLLDLTDNYKENAVLNPRNIICYDDHDPYLVVAADKGTATFSDIANAISKEYGFWLGDAFASGGITGYDHKKMGITARGAWESVKRHFHELGLDLENNPFTVIGIGDMAGDVFGNGMLLSKKIKLVAAFNHEHIFLDPNPDSDISFSERQRLFQLPRSGWNDYNPELISKGGGVYLRSAKSINLSPEIQNILDVHQNTIVPSDLIKAILKSPVDLLWNGGIGTYVKATFESNAMVGDRANDILRINGKELRARVVGEGGNLGFTQYGRVEYAKSGGRINTDAIDNSGGVNCSDNEVNIKILLNDVVLLGELTEQQRNIVLAEVQNEVGELVLKNNRLQPKAISVALSQAVDNLEMHGRLMKEMERTGKLNRVVECLPDKEEIANRKLLKQGLTRPELAVLMAYSKTVLKEALLGSNIPEEPYFQLELEHAFPLPLQTRFKEYMPRHRLKREIIGTQLSNAVVNEMGISFINRLIDETGSEAPDIVRAYTISRKIFKAEELYGEIDVLPGVDADTQFKMLHEINRLIRRGTRWFLRNRRRENIDIAQIIEYFKPKVTELSIVLPQFLLDYGSDMKVMAERLIQSHVPKDLAYRIGSMSAMFSALDIVEAASINKFSVEKVATIYYAVGTRLQLGWFRELIKNHIVNNHWEALARATFRDDLDRQQRNLAVNIMRHNGDSLNEPEHLIDSWFGKHHILVSRWEYFATELKNSPEADFTMFAVALRELLDLAEASIHSHQ
jgi:glutamate dehydrogenase